MPESEVRRREERVLVLAEHRRDGELTRRILRAHGLDAAACLDVGALAREIERGVGVLVLGEEALDDAVRQRLADLVTAQPRWSDLPIVVFAREGSSVGQLLFAFEDLCNVAVLERPVQIATLVSTVRAAVRARRRQYEVRDLIERLQESDRRKDEFLALLGHELRNPLGVILTSLELQRHLADEPGTSRHLDRIEHQLTHLSRMVDDLLDLSRISRGKVQLQRGTVDLRTAAVEARTACHGLARGKDQEVVVDVPDEPVWVDGDRLRLEQVAWNLVSNACKYSPQDSVVRVRVRQEDGWALLEVSDDGMGLEGGELEAIFEPFVQMDRSLARSGGGLGLGLPLVRQLVELHGGSVSAASGGVGAGSLFTVRLPLHVEGNEEEPEAPPQRPGGAASAGALVLVVEDIAEAREAIGELLGLWGYRPLLAADGASGLDLARRHRPPVALVDIGLPVMDGYELGGRLRRELGADLLMIATTGYGQDAYRERSQPAGFDHHLVTRVEPARLRELPGDDPPSAA
jgi:signal transduction histidine kinase/CheY-like chemotaxis protein